MVFGEPSSCPFRPCGFDGLRTPTRQPQTGFELSSDERPAVPTILKKSCELVHRKPGLSNQRPQGSFSQFFMVGNGEASVRWGGVPKNDVATVLIILFVSDLSECLDCLAARYHRQLHPLATSMTSSRMLGGNGSPCFRRLFK
jgi:hypothetical protein